MSLATALLLIAVIVIASAKATTLGAVRRVFTHRRNDYDDVC